MGIWKKKKKKKVWLKNRHLHVRSLDEFWEEKKISSRT